jgi:hypothetical protein
MERNLSVNVDPEREGTAEPFNSGFAPSPVTDQGPCLYLGPAGQRCGRRAQEGGFCAQHQPGSPSAQMPVVSPRRVGIILMILALLWPILLDIVRAVIRLVR